MLHDIVPYSWSLPKKTTSKSNRQFGKLCFRISIYHGVALKIIERLFEKD